MYQYILFDLDGTLTDPMVGITTSVQYALAHMDIHEPDIHRLKPFIGPPLEQSFSQFYGMDSVQAKMAVEKYRERYKDIGIYENLLYPGITQLLENLKKAGFKLAIASSKPTVFVIKILEYFSINHYFDVVVGSELDGHRSDKKEVIEEVLRQFGIMGQTGTIKKSLAKKTVMVGDRSFDILGAKAHGLDSIGVTYGYGIDDELAISGATYLVLTVKELEQLLLPKKKEFYKISYYFLTILLGISISLFLNIFVALISVEKYSTDYMKTAQIQYSIPLWQGILRYGLIIPIIEELAFRGFLFTWLKKHMNWIVAAVFSSLVFGIYHGNVVQFFYAFIMGMCLAWLYEKSHKLQIPILFHGSANIAAYLTTMTILGTIINTPVFCVIFGLLTGLILLLIIRMNQRMNSVVKIKK